jgi:hypothetical protein
MSGVITPLPHRPLGVLRDKFSLPYKLLRYETELGLEGTFEQIKFEKKK